MMYPVMAYRASNVEELMRIMDEIKGARSFTALAADLGYSKQYVSNVYNGVKDPSDHFLAELGVERVVTTQYVRTTDAIRRKK